MSTSVYFQTFTASSIDGGIAFRWSYLNGFNPATITNLCINISDSNVADLAYEMSYVNIPVYTDTSAGSVPTTYYEVSSISNAQNVVQLVNGHTYDATPEITVTVGGVTSVESVYDFSVMPSGIPPVPNFTLTQSGGTEFTVTLLDASGVAPEPVSIFDNYSILTGVYIVYNDGLKINTKYIANDVNNSIYSGSLVVSGVERRLHEVSIKVANINGISGLTKPKPIRIKSIPSEVYNLQSIQNIFVDASASVGNAQNRLTWTTPAFIGDPSLNGYSIYRNGSFLAVVSDISANINIRSNFVYVDSNGLVPGQQYTYTIYSTSSVTSIPDNALSVQTIVNSVIPATMKPITKTPSNGKVTLDVSANLNGFAANEVTFDVSMNGQITNYAATNFDIIGATVNGTKYNFQVRAKSVRTVDAFTTFNSAWSDVLTSMPYAPVESITGLTATPIDVSLNPLDGKVRLSWTAPANASYRDPSFNIAIYSKLVGSVDASYVAVTTTILQGVTSHVVTGLTNGTEYTFKVVKRQTLVETGEVQESAVPTTVNATPFARPSAITNLVFADASMAYSFTRSDSNGGLTIDGYELNLVNISNGLTQDVISLDLTVRDASLNLITSGNLLNYILPGRNYRLAVRPFVTFNGAKVYSESAVTDNAFSRPEALAAPTVVNVENGVPLNGQLRISWVLNAGYDASNATYDVYRGQAPAVSGSSQNLTGTSYINTGLTNGQSSSYFVVVKIGSLSSPTTGVTAITTGTPFNYAPAITGLISTVMNNSSVDLSWNNFTQSQIQSSGVALANIRYKVQWTNSDMSGQTLNLTSNTASITGLTSGHVYTVSVISGVLSNGIVYYNDSVPTTLQITPYSTPGQPVNLAVFPSDSTFLVDCANAAEVSGLTFKCYRMNYGVSGGQTITYSSNSDQTNSLFYTTNVENGTTYSVKVALVYLNALNQEIVSVAAIDTVTPLQAPNTPSGIGGESIGNNQVVLSWNYDSDVQYYSIYKDNEILLAHVPTEGSDIILDVSKFKTTIPNLTAGTTYNFKIVAEQLLQGSSIYVSSQAGYIDVTPYSTPSAVRDLFYIPTSTNIDLSWNEPSDKGGANVGGNGGLQYSVEIFNGSNKLSTYANTSSTNLSIINYVDISNITQPLSPSIQYTFKVYALFIVGSGPSTSIGPATQIVTQLKRTVNTPVLTLNALATTGDGKSVQLALQLDPSATVYTIEVRRVIKSPSNVLLGTVNYTSVTGWSVDASNIARLTDGPGVSNIGADSNNFLNGNKIEYICRVSYTNWSVNYSPVVQSSLMEVFPSGKPIFTSLAFDASKNLTVVYSRNGADINSVTAIGISTNDNGVQVLTPDLVDGSNNQINGSIAQNQQVTLRILTGAWNNSAEEALVIVAGVNGTVLKAAPATNSFVNLSS
jgi:hypothetical protein